MEPVSAAQDDCPQHLVILVHGINTRAQWMTEIKQELEQNGFAVAATSYGSYSVIRFLLPFSWARKKPIKRVSDDVRTARKSYKLMFNKDPKYMSAISHSFGTFVISEIIKSNPEFHWERVIFCGSVVREDFEFESVLGRFRPPLLNEVGSQDYLPAIAESAGWVYGSAGSTGFNRPPVDTRWHRGFRHSDFLNKEFCRKFWIPFLRGERPISGDASSQLPLHVRVLTLFPLRYLVLIAPIIILTIAGLIALDKWKTWDWALPYVGTLEERQSQLQEMARHPPGSLRPAYLKLYGAWKFRTNGEMVRFAESISGNMATFSYFGDVIISPTTRGDASITFFGNGLLCSYEISIQSNRAMVWVLAHQSEGFLSTPGVNERCPPTSQLDRVE